MSITSAASKHYIALDLGTTTLAGQLLTDRGEIVSQAQVSNPQQELGADVLVRLQKAVDGGGEQLQGLLIDGLRSLVFLLLKNSPCSGEEIAAVAAAGNPAMTCLLQRLPVDSLLAPPYKPPQRELVCLPQDELDLGLPLPLELLPLVSGFVGGDLVACLLAQEELQPGTLLIDIGTNAELALWDGSRWLVTSAAAGPAFEGANISSGMVLADGAVTDVTLVDDRLSLAVAGKGQPSGLCGSGLAALIAAALQGGLIEPCGRIRQSDEVETNLARYLVAGKGSRSICFYRSATGELLLTQQDVRNFQLAKGAVRAAVQVLLDRKGMTLEAVREVLVTGALGQALPLEVLKRVALLPEAMLDKTRFVENAVLAGLRSYLTDLDGRENLASLMSTIQPFPLSGTPAFEQLFLASLDFDV